MEHAVPHIFFSYSSRDRPEVELFAQIVKKSHGLSYWIASNEILPGDSVIGKINEGLSISEVVVLWVTASSMRSVWVKTEWESALAQQSSQGSRRIIPIIAEGGIQVPTILADLARLNLSEGLEETASKLAKRVRYGCVGDSNVFFRVLRPPFGTNCKAFWVSPGFSEELAKLWTGKTGSIDPHDYEYKFQGTTSAPAGSVVKLDIQVEGTGGVLWPQPGGEVSQGGVWEATGYLRHGRMHNTTLVFTVYAPGTIAGGALPLVKRAFRIEP
jgi:hypothetical protein